MEKIKLSVCYIVKNEETNLPISLNSVKDAADELIVVDTGSDDNTKNIAREFGANVVDFLWQDDFSAPRNYAIDQARGVWILFLDADEVFSEPLDKMALLAFLESVPDKEVVLLMRRNVDSLTEKSSYSTDWSPRIFRRREDLRYQGRVHEHIVKSDGDLQVAYAPMEFCLLHTGYAASISESKCQRDLQILQQVITDGYWEPVYEYYLTDCYYGIHNYEEALRHAIAFVQSDTVVYGGNGHIYRMILESMRALAMPDYEMLPWAEEACRLYPDLPEFYAERGMVLCGLGRLREAKDLLEESLWRYRAGTADFRHETYFSTEVAAKVAARLGEIAACNGDKETAARWFIQAIDYCSTSATVLNKASSFLVSVEK